jgi:alpha-1,2-mannosyltransferase
MVVYPTPSREYWLHLVFDTRRPGSPAFYGNQSLFAVLHRLNITWIWLPLAVILGMAGLLRARRAHEAGSEIAAVALVGLTAVVVSPISWQHHGVWIVLAAAVLIAWATTVPRVLIAAGAIGVFLLPLDYWGQRLFTLGATTPWFTMLLRNAYAIAFIGLLLLLPLPRREGQSVREREMAWR